MDKAQIPQDWQNVAHWFNAQGLHALDTPTVHMLYFCPARGSLYSSNPSLSKCSQYECKKINNPSMLESYETLGTIKVHLNLQCRSCPLFLVLGKCISMLRTILLYINTYQDRKNACVTYYFVRSIDLLQLLSNIPCSIWASIIYDYNFIADSTKIKKKWYSCLRQQS